VEFGRHIKRPPREDRDAIDDELVDNEDLTGLIPEDLKPKFSKLHAGIDDDVEMEDVGTGAQAEMHSMMGVFGRPTQKPEDLADDPDEEDREEGQHGHPLAWVNFRRIIELTKDISPTHQLLIFGADKVEKARLSYLEAKASLQEYHSKRRSDVQMGDVLSKPDPTRKVTRTARTSSRSTLHRPPRAGSSTAKKEVLGKRPV
jgi:hypothetical protein